MPSSEFLRRRNALWRQLREGVPGTPEFEETLAELSRLIHWDRPRVLAALGWREPDVPRPQGEP
ncbi:hypothetical protein [Deinococcus sp. YIM 77859]|uniref:hypothetical protein n=1 Tax=Deinococcus sp. YIM 77859 TaxID=1540221 RepID=UPI0009E018D7|nr:hypothetical protein [Deinococcus sp. YIM 77859]